MNASILKKEEDVWVISHGAWHLLKLDHGLPSLPGEK